MKYVFDNSKILFVLLLFTSLNNVSSINEIEIASTRVRLF
jgi:hypothetical protein